MNYRLNNLTIGTLILALSAMMWVSGSKLAQADAGFQRWVRDFRGVAAKYGIKGSTYDRAFQGINSPDPEVLEKARYQPEFRAEPWNYFDNRVNDHSVAVGKQMARKWRPWLDRIERKYGVDRDILLAIWSMETNYGEIMKNDKVMRPAVRSLATLAYADKRRRKYARSQLISALKIYQRGDVSLNNLTGSWAGALGHTQFIPTSYEAYAQDMDGDGRRDIWNSVPDALATAANLLKKNGWRSGQTWGYEVVLPSGRKFPSGTLSISQWQKLGIRRANGRSFPSAAQKAELKVPDGRAGPAFLVIKNFYVLKRYNNATKYALAVGLLGDRIGGYSGLVRDWNRPFTPLSFAERQELQKRLARAGFYDGKIDGKIGSGSREAIMAYQARVGMAQTGHPSKEVLNRLKR